MRLKLAYNDWYMLRASPWFPGAVQDTESCLLALSDDNFPDVSGMQYMPCCSQFFY
jgi:hypothetical protein